MIPRRDFLETTNFSGIEFYRKISILYLEKVSRKRDPGNLAGIVGRIDASLAASPKFDDQYGYFIFYEFYFISAYAYICEKIIFRISFIACKIFYIFNIKIGRRPAKIIKFPSIGLENLEEAYVIGQYIIQFHISGYNFQGVTIFM